MKRYLPFLLFCFLGNSLLAQLMVPTFDQREHLGGQGTQTGVFTFPDDVSIYNQVLMHIDLDCAAVGCDPFDRIAHIKIVKGLEEFEIGRYATPFGIGTCGWTLDVSEYREMLSGSVMLKSQIETFANGWDLTLDFEFIEGAPTYQYTKVENLWNGFDATNNRNYFDYQVGDTLWTKDDLPIRTANIAADAEQVIFRIFQTGHGQGNTGNAAEFRASTHAVSVNGALAFSHTLWKEDCNQNPCSPQNGTWQFARAGWCPGQEIPAIDFDMTSLVTPGEPVVLDYILDTYLNRCSPLYPACSPATDCAFGNQVNCGYDGNLHTQPRYKMSIQLITKSNAPLATDDLAKWRNFEILPNPNYGKFWIDITFDGQEDAQMTIVNSIGEKVLVKAFKQTQHLIHEVDLTAFNSGIYFVAVQTENGTAVKKVMLQNQ